MTEEQNQSGYEVGYRKPPAKHRFKKGQSGNPKGRPKGARNRPRALDAGRLEDIILAEAYREVRVPDGDQVLTMPIAQVALRSMAAKAAKGDHRSQKLLAELVATVESKRYRQQTELLEATIDYKRHWEEVLRERERANLPAPDPMPLPHPADIHIDPKLGTFEVRGPMTQEDVDVLEGSIEYLEDLLDEIDELAKCVETATTDEDAAGYARLLGAERERVDRFLTNTQCTSERWPRHWPPRRLRDRLPRRWQMQIDSVRHS